MSAHFFIRRDGELIQFVSCDRRAWHAGASSWRGRANCNDYSIGIELEGLEGELFEPAQYRTLARVLRALRRRYPVRDVVGHEQVAPGRKADPGAGFDAQALRRLLRPRRPTCALDVLVGRPLPMRPALAKRLAAPTARGSRGRKPRPFWRTAAIAA